MIISNKECYETFMTHVLPPSCSLCLSLPPSPTLWRQLSTSGSFNLEREKQLGVNIDFKSTCVLLKPAAWQPAVFN